MKIAFATCEEKPQGTEDDLIFKSELEACGHQVFCWPWTSTEADYSEVNWSKVDGCVVRSTWDYHKKLPQFLQWAEKVSQQTRLINSLEILRWNSKKNYLMELAGHGWEIVPTVISIDQSQCLKEAEKLLLKYKTLVIKPEVSASAHLTFCVSTNDEAKKAIEAVLTRSAVMLQPFVESVFTEGEVSLIFFRDKNQFQFSHAVKKIPKKGDYRVQSEHGGSVELYHPQSQLTQKFSQLLNELETKLKGKMLYARVDLVNWSSTPLLMELELIEPELFFRFSQDFAKKLTHKLLM